MLSATVMARIMSYLFKNLSNVAIAQLATPEHQPASQTILFVTQNVHYCYGSYHYSCEEERHHHYGDVCTYIQIPITDCKYLVWTINPKSTVIL